MFLNIALINLIDALILLSLASSTVELITAKSLKFRINSSVIALNKRKYESLDLLIFLANLNKTFSITPISNTGNVIVSDNSTLRGVDHGNNSLTNFVASQNSYRVRRPNNTCSTYYKTKYGILYHNNKVYFTGAYRSNETNLYELNTTTGICQRLEFFGNRRQVYGRLLVSNDILIFPHKNHWTDYRIYLRDTNSGSEMTCNPTFGSELFNSMQYGYSSMRMPAAIDASGNLLIKSYEGG